VEAGVPYLIDGSNLCGAARDRRLGLPRDEQEMIRLLAAFAGRRRALVTVVFDGPADSRRGSGRAASAGRVKVFYSGGDRNADDTIVSMVRDSRTPKQIILVSSDRELRSRVRSQGCRVMGCREFSDLLHKAAASGRGDPDAEVKPLPGDTDEWMRWFSSRGPRGPSS